MFPVSILYTILRCLTLFVPVTILAGPAQENDGMGSDAYHAEIPPALENMINQYIKQKKYNLSISKLEEEIKKDPNNTTLMYKQASIYADIEEYYKAKKVLSKIEKIQPKNERANKLSNIVNKKIIELPHNEVGIDQNEEYVSDLKAYWTNTSFHYFRINEMGIFGGRINYANRFGKNGVQYQIETYPKILDNMYANITLGYANYSQILFPNLQYRIEPYFNFANGIEFSVGRVWQKYITFDNQKISNYTGTIGKYIGNYYIWYRPSYYEPTSTTFNEIGIRRYFKDKYNYITMKLNGGKLPDIGDIPPLDQIVLLRQKGISLDGEYSLTKTIFLKGAIGYTWQYYVKSMLRRDITNGTISLVYQY